MSLAQRNGFSNIKSQCLGFFQGRTKNEKYVFWVGKKCEHPTPGTHSSPPLAAALFILRFPPGTRAMAFFLALCELFRPSIDDWLPEHLHCIVHIYIHIYIYIYIYSTRLPPPFFISLSAADSLFAKLLACNMKLFFCPFLFRG